MIILPSTLAIQCTIGFCEGSTYISQQTKSHGLKRALKEENDKRHWGWDWTLHFSSVADFGSSLTI